MAKLTEFSKQSVAAIQREMAEAAAAVAAKHGISIKPGRGTFDSHTAKLSFNLATVDESGSAHTPYLDNLKQFGAMYGVDPALANKEFTYHGSRFRLLGLDLSKRKMPVIAQRADGKHFKFGVEIAHIIAAA